MPDLWSDLLECLDLHPVPSGGTGEERADDAVTEFEGRNQRLEYHRVFGGQLLGQFIRIASATFPAKDVKSQRTVFTREGPGRRTHSIPSHPPARRSILCHRRHHRPAEPRGGGHIVDLYARTENGRERQTVDEVPAVVGPDHEVALDLIPWETRATVDLNASTTGPPQFEVWMRTPAVDPELAPALAAYATGLTLIGTALRPMDGVDQRGNGTVFTSAVTSHTIWFHRPFRTDGWLLLRQHSPLLAHGRSFGRGDVLTEDGTLVASYAQEALLRFAS